MPDPQRIPVLYLLRLDRAVIEICLVRRIKVLDDPLIAVGLVEHGVLS